MTTRDGPSSPRFRPVELPPSPPLETIPVWRVTAELAGARSSAPTGDCVWWGIPFHVAGAVVVADEPVVLPLDVSEPWLVFLHTSDLRPLELEATRGPGRLGEVAARYIVVFEDGIETPVQIRRRYEIGPFQRGWGENCFGCVAATKPYPVRPHHEQPVAAWGWSQTRVHAGDDAPWVWWLWAWHNPRPGVRVRSLRLEPVSGTVILGAVSAGSVTTSPLVWKPRRKALLTVESPFDPTLDSRGLLAQAQLDLGQIITAEPATVYPADWETGHNNQLPTRDPHRLLVEYTSHDEALFHLANGATLPLPATATGRIQPVAVAQRRVTLVVRAVPGGPPVPVKLHVHGEAGEYHAPLDRHRIANDAWFEDYAPEFVHAGLHRCTYINGETTLDLPLGRVYVEISKGFEIRPIRRILTIGPETHTLEILVERVLPWRERGWVTADTHVHFLSPMTALLEGSAEGVNLVNLLASQWGELMTNVGDFDGKTTWGSREAGGDGEHLVRVGTENRQHVLGHISLLGYGGPIITPLTSGGPDESALGDPVEVLLTEWARACRAQGGVVVLPHFPNPRAEHAAALVTGQVDGVEMTSWGNLYAGINPYSLADWYRYLNCGYRTAAVGGTDKMSANTAVGTVRTYARLERGAVFGLAAWMEALREARTFVTYGPLIELAVEGRPLGSRIRLPRGGGAVEVTWETASVTIPMSRVELVVSGEIRESLAVSAERAAGSFRVRADRSAWVALLVRGAYPGRPEVVAAHSSPVMLDVEDSPYRAAADALTILEQIEGALAYLDTLGTRAETAAYKRMRLVLEGAHRAHHNRMHAQGHYHDHTPPEDHPAHH